eukprot:1154928-Pyramimonas_sp.AAC.1
MPKVAAVSSSGALTSAALKALEPLMAVPQNSPELVGDAGADLGPRLGGGGEHAQDSLSTCGFGGHGPNGGAELLRPQSVGLRA